MSVKGTNASVVENAVLANDKRGFPFRKVFFGILVALVVISLILLVINLVINSYFSRATVFDGEWEINVEKMNSMPMYQDNEAYFSQTEELHTVYDAALLNYAQASSDLKNDPSVFNYAIFGTDQFGASNDASADIIMLASVNKIDEHVTYLAFETKMLVYIPSVGVGPMSDAYVLGGPQLLADTISLNYGIQIDGFVDLDMSAFADIIDEYGSIKLDANKAFVEKLNEDIKAFNEAKGLTGDAAAKSVTLLMGATSGYVNLDGKQALAYLRNSGEAKASNANEVLSQLTAMLSKKGLGGAKEALDLSLEKTTISLVRDDVGALIMIGYSVLNKVESIPVGNMEGRTFVYKARGYTCNYQAERAAIVDILY